MCNLSMSVKAAPLMISGALNGPSSCLWYDEGTTKLLAQYLTSMESCDVQDSNSTSYICVTSVCPSMQPLRWSPVHWMVHPAVCDMMRGSPSFLLSILYHWNAVICRMQTVYLIYSTCNLHISVNTGCPIISRSLNRSAWRCPDGLLSLIYQS